MAVGSKYRLRQFEEILGLRNSVGKPLLLNGGQNVNGSTQRHLVIKSRLAAPQPFTGEDINFQCDQSDVEVVR